LDLQHGTTEEKEKVHQRKLAAERLLSGLFLTAIALCVVAAFHFINLEAALILLFFNLIFICLTFELNGTPSIKLGMLALGNVVGLLWNIVLFSFAAAGSAYFGETFNILCGIARPFLNFMWIISFWSLSLSVFPKPEKPRTEKKA